MEKIESLRARFIRLAANLVYLIRLERSGRYVRQRLMTIVQSGQSTKARAVRRLVPVGSQRFRVAAKLTVEVSKGLDRLTVILGKRNNKKLHPEVLAVQSSTAKITFEPATSPRVSVIIPVHNNWLLTQNCLRSLVLHPSTVEREIIVVDDASSDETPQRLSEIEDIRIVRLDENVGFLRAVHAGFQQATAPYVVLLNNDTIVRPQWLDALVETLDHDETVGMVGSVLLYPNGLMQEAGSAIFNDGTGVNVGKRDRAYRDIYKTPHEVDYCSGASLLIRRTLWDQIGGFDLNFAPAYYEETDLSFATRAAGYRVFLQPKSQLFHFEGGTYGTDETPVKRELMDRNREKFLAKWHDVMKEQWSPGTENWTGASWRTKRGRVLVVDARVPEPDRDSGSVRMFAIVKILKEMGFGVTFLSMVGVVEDPYASQLRDLEVEVIDARVSYANEIQRLGSVLVAAILSRPNEAKTTLPFIREYAPQAKVFYDTVDLHYVREERRAEIENSDLVRREAAAFKATELGLINEVDATFVTTEVERVILREVAPHARVAILSNIHTPEMNDTTPDGRAGLLFVGNFQHQPNVDAMIYFIKEVFPLLQSQRPEITLEVVGANMPAELSSLAGPKVHMLGWVQDLTPVYARTRVVIAPLRYGAGIKGKVGEAAMQGVPVVCTSVAIEGMLIEPGSACLVGDTPEAFAQEVLRLYDDHVLWQKIATNAQVALLAQCSPEVARQNIEEVFAATNVPAKILR